MSWRYRKNIAIFGGTRQGKTVGANEIYAKDRRLGLMFQPDPENWLTGTIVNSTKDIIKGIAKGRKKFLMKASLWSNVEEKHEHVCKWVVDRCDKVEGFNVTMVHDEAQDLSTEYLNICLKRGLKRGLRNILVTQSPASRQVPLESLRQCDYYVWVGPISSMSYEYIARKDLFDPEALLNNKDHQYRVVNRTGEEIEKGFFDNQRFGDG